MYCGKWGKFLNAYSDLDLDMIKLNIELVQAINSQNKPDFICIQESWLKNSINFKLDNYSLVRKDRFNERGGGVCIFIKNNIVFKIKENDFINNIEYVHMEFFMNNKYFNLVYIYIILEEKLIEMNMIFFSHLIM